MRAALDAIDAHIGRRLRYQRTLTGLSQMKLGNQSGVSFQQIQKYEGGVNGISASSLLLFAHILNVPVNWFYEEITPSLWGGICSPPLSKQMMVFCTGEKHLI
ncbi:MAG: helix-turn-helix transcriptional regulator [Alphaproteobacteria bacterium]